MPKPSHPNPELVQQITALLAENGVNGTITAWQAVQALWSGYGMIWRCTIDGSQHRSLIIKAIDVHAEARSHPRGWQGGHSHQRKVQSYAVETAFYRRYAHPSNSQQAETLSASGSPCRVPALIAESRSQQQPWLLILEDLQQAGFNPAQASQQTVLAGLDWLAAFHARCLHSDTHELWPQGTYWHLATRPDELAQMADGPLKQHAARIDQAIHASPYQTLVHGDAKLANFCADSAGLLAAVDFQYVGGGCGIADVAYFLGSILSSDECFAQHDALLNYYRERFITQLQHHYPQYDAGAIITDWLQRYPMACADFARFLEGWCPGHHKMHRYSAHMTELALQNFDKT